MQAVPGDRPCAFEGPVELDDGHAANVGIFGMDHVELRASGATHLLPERREIARLVGADFKAQRRRVDKRVEHATVADVHRDRADAFDFERRAEPFGETRHVADRDGAHLAAVALRRHVDRAARHVEPKPRFRLLHRRHSGLEEHGRHAHRVGAGHRRRIWSQSCSNARIISNTESPGGGSRSRPPRGSRRRRSGETISCALLRSASVDSDQSAGPGYFGLRSSPTPLSTNCSV